MLVIDVEATGTEPQKHSIVSIGALDFDHPENRFYGECRMFPGAHVMEGALAVNGYTMKEIEDPEKQPESELIIAFLEWSQHLSDRTLAGQNVSFDRDMLRHAAERAGASWDLAHRTIDTHSFCYMHMVTRGVTPPIDQQHRRSALNPDSVLTYCGIPEEPKPHNALTGALCHAEVIARLLYGRQLLPEFVEFPVPF